MQITHHFTTPRLGAALVALIGVLSTLDVAAQHYYPDSRSGNGKGYWRLATDYASRSTLVKFYDADHQLIYQESLRGKYVRLTKKNIRRLDRTLDQLSGNQLLASTLKFTELSVHAPQSLQKIPTSGLRDESQVQKMQEAARGIRINVHPYSNSGKFCLLFENPNQEKIMIVLKNENGQVMYEEQTSLARYNRNFDLSQMKYGQFILEMKARKLSYSRQIALHPAVVQPSVAISPADTALNTSIAEALND